ncbi:Tic20 family protein [Gloeobacter violaceus]|uniref:Glr3297 protein n=1 Tax=Gloeobacter violaceus (strain ATCC 29082 / PCC 7421) TaxID=251221 RepID=Q7NG76_GLOVI|nr:Tic20 family protein [Gloeobacter violaceus]BAC91238.1 glr3297 [Gloeobacter violaceus PCC 7421]
MSWRGSTSPSDRIFASLPYLLPMAASLAYGVTLLSQLGLGAVIQILAPINFLNSGFIGLAVFIALFALVVNNTSISHFIRFNVFQALLVGIILSLFSLVLPLLVNMFAFLPGIDVIQQTLGNTLFLGVFAFGIYGIVQSLLGRYAEVPTISEVVYSQLR